MPPARPFENHLVALCENGLPPAAEWTAELQAAGLDIEVHPARFNFSVHDCLVPMSVCGHLAPVGFKLAKKRHHDWFPSEISREHPAEAVFLIFGPKGINAAAWEQAAHWAAAASLVHLGRARLFDAGGIRTDSPREFYARARRLMADLVPQPHPDPEDPNLDLRTEWARDYDNRH
ncbi:MAG: hypothetical protein K0Q72_794 [Armatimonadetes bacterium]|jgi:hypothetical protein|nr:hypothetical protein [Armatimonadota bacterium]